MFGIFMESLVIFKLYTGLRGLFVLSLLAWIYLLFREKDKTIRALFVYAPILILVVFLFPLSRKFFVAAGLFNKNKRTSNRCDFPFPYAPVNIVEVHFFS